MAWQILVGSDFRRWTYASMHTALVIAMYSTYVTGPGKTGLIVIFSKFRFCLKRIAYDVNKCLAKFQQSIYLYAGVAALNRVSLLCMKVKKYLFKTLSHIIRYDSKQIR